MMNDPKDPFHLSRKHVFLWGTGVTALLCGLVVLYAPSTPKNLGVYAPLQGPGSEGAQYGIAEATAAPASVPVTAGEGPGLSANAATEGAGGPPSVSSLRGLDLAPEQAAYKRFCSQCHGDDGRGDTQIARMMTSAKPTNLVSGPFQHGRDQATVAGLIRNGVGAMPGFKAEINEEQAAKLADWVLGFPERAEKAGSQAPGGPSAPEGSSTPVGPRGGP